MNRVYINNAEYSIIFNSDLGVDTDKLCSVFVFLRGHKNGARRYKPEGKLRHYGLLKKKTGLSRHAIEKYTPKLIKLGLVTLNSDGGVSVISSDRSYRLFKGDKLRKILIPINMEGSYIKTSINIGYVRVKANAKHQRKQIDKKETQKQTLKKYVYLQKNPESFILSKKEIRSCEKLIEHYGSVDKFISQYCEETILSQNGYSKLNKGMDGQYFKKQLLNGGFIESTKRTEVILNNISYKKFKSVKSIIIDIHGGGIYWCPLIKGVVKVMSCGFKELI